MKPFVVLAVVLAVAAAKPSKVIKAPAVPEVAAVPDAGPPVPEPVVVAPPPPDPAAAQAFVDVVKVLQSPRCVNCHPNGDAPTIHDDGSVHAMGVTRNIEKVGMNCQTCHRETAVALEPGMPPAVKGWKLPPKETPMVFRGRTASEICQQMKDPAQNGGKDLAALLHHVDADDLVLYGWNPGPGRTLPPLSHADFVARFKTWVDGGAPCP